MKYLFTALLTAVVALMFLAAPATADWNVGDPHKMHFPQLPDPNGWDVPFHSYSLEEFEDPPGSFFERSTDRLSDDWKCSQDGDVTDIHFWVSRRMYGEPDPQPAAVPFKITWVDAWIWGNIPAEDNTYGFFSMPDYQNGWHGGFSEDEVEVVWAGDGDQGWYDPASWSALANDHRNYYQVNITGIDAPFFQTEGEIYWLELWVEAEDLNGQWLGDELGWKTADTEGYPSPYTGEHYEDDAIYWSQDWDETGQLWFGPEELRDPFDEHSLDLAFVITPEPGTWAMLLAAGLVGLLACARRRRKR